MDEPTPTCTEDELAKMWLAKADKLELSPDGLKVARAIRALKEMKPEIDGILQSTPDEAEAKKRVDDYIKRELNFLGLIP